MISYLNGSIKFIGDRFLVLDVNGVGYKIWSVSEFCEKIKLGENKELWTFTNVKENELSLFGFEEKDQLDFFEILIGVNGVGPKTALEILALSIEKLKSAIVNGDVATLKQVKGIGQKAAERLIVELKNKIGDFEISELKNGSPDSSSEIFEDAILALESLGFKKGDIVKKIRNAPNQDTSEDLVTRYLSAE